MAFWNAVSSQFLKSVFIIGMTTSGIKSGLCLINEVRNNENLLNPNAILYNNHIRMIDLTQT